MIIRRKTRRIGEKFVQRKLVFRLRRLAIVLVVMSGIITYDLIMKHASPLLAATGLAAGYILGKVMGKYANVHWHEETGKVIAKLDRTGIILLVVYLIFSLSRRWLLGFWIHGIQLSVISVSIAAGGMIGRIISIRKQIRGILRGKGILPPKIK